MSKMSLRARWHTEHGMRLTSQILETLAAGGALTDLAIDRHQGRADLRGFSLPGPEAVGSGLIVEDGPGGLRPGAQVHLWSDLITFRDLRIADVDFSEAHLEHLRFFDSRLTNCVFDKARCRDWRAWNTAFEYSQFRGTDLRDSALGTWEHGNGNTYTVVDFTRADLRGIACQRAGFTECVFDRAKLVNVEFEACGFVRCRFAGLLDGTRFLGEPTGDGSGGARFQDVDFTDATFRRVEFRGVNLGESKLPSKSAVQVVVRNQRCVVQRALETLAQLPAPMIRLQSLLEVRAELMDASSDMAVWHVDELGRTTEEQQFAVDLLQRLDRECAGPPESAS